MYKILLVLFILLMLVAIGWYRQEVAPPSVDSPSDLVVEGYIFALEEDRLLVAEGLAPDVDTYTGVVDELEGAAYTFTLTPDTIIETSAGEVTDRAALELYRGVSVWVSGPVRESYPAQAEADRIEVRDEEYPAPTAAADFSVTGNLLRDNPGLPPGVWHVSYEAPGQPGLVQPLIITEESRCEIDDIIGSCDSAQLTPGDRVSIEGTETEDGVLVQWLRVQ